MTALDDLRADLHAARAALLAALDGMTQEEFARRPPAEADDGDDDAPAGAGRWPARDLLWHAGVAEDWLRRVLSQATGGRPLDAFVPRRRPAIANTLPYLVEWLDQCRRPLLALLRNLREDQLDARVTLPESGPVAGTHTVRALIGRIAEDDRAHAERVRALRALPAEPER